MAPSVVVAPHKRRARKTKGVREMTKRFQTLSAKGITLTLDLAVGHIRSLDIESGGHRIQPLHTAPWVEDPAIADDPDIASGLKFLSGDFFCAPFCASDVEDAPPHGWPANSRWAFEGEESHGNGVTARFVLERSVIGAQLVKELTLREGHPFVYQRHTFRGGSGAVPVASHAMTHFAGKGQLSFSPKAFAELPATQQETDPARGRSVFERSARFTDLAKLPLADGRTVDIHEYPVAERHEDFVMLVEASGARLGWTTAARFNARDIMISLKNPMDFPVTFLWFSNGGRDYAPWNGRHRGVLGIEEGRAYSMYGHAASIAPNPLSRSGIPTSLALNPDNVVSVCHVIGGIPLPAGWRAIRSIEPAGEVLRVTSLDEKAVEHPFDSDFLAGRKPD